ncbi:hypothetical protein [Mesorhizobium sp. M00.F.Ca.ET.217.01.1.1]|uniref:hypothetical protein n=1 Tax=Mesorhizobium sp. M00.F.Ca.ET.217.01.1.1 TaxID=2500529 RepID=UPI000FD85306|nr:hypothetical protein [Mesorhizobium sp. M00.F.Ca.ET.217.01.1.1]TGQ15917.1 hypothetical protein EN860_025525 [Mesorhizobium sp. M00.F.Ca.ET.217.01.1.1]TGV87138.1 hypothetical protein EN801_026465 [Mesorhizobium sp. M00.F.Ca.ET.158.01.1.1]
MAIPTLDHANEAALWFTENRGTCPRPIIPHLRRVFNLSPLEACAALRMANLRMAWAVTTETEGGADVAQR